MKTVVIESHVPFTDGAFGHEARVVKLAPDDITRERLIDERADALIIRTRTRCDRSLLEGTAVSAVATATIGTDHIDLPYCASRGIMVANAPGCNAPAVAQYVFAAILRQGGGQAPADLALGVVGCGHVGSIVARWGRQLGYTVIECDPPRALREPGYRSATIDEVASRADIITFHTPHTTTGPHATHHLADAAFFNRLERHPLIVNAARGPVVDTPALLDALADRRVRGAVIDCWEGEPVISTRLLRRCVYATPHIAGYSVEGKKRATQMAVNAILAHWGSDRRLDLGIPSGAADTVTAEAITAGYDPAVDTEALLHAFATAPDSAAAAQAFERLRNCYPLRRETR